MEWLCSVTVTFYGYPSRKHAYIVLTPLKPHFYTVKLGFTGVYINFLISAQIDCGYSLEPRRFKFAVCVTKARRFKFAVRVTEGQDRLPTLHWLPKLHKRPYKARFNANSSSCTTTELSKLLTLCLTAIKNM